MSFLRLHHAENRMCRDFAVPFSYMNKDYVKAYSQEPNGSGHFTDELVPLAFDWINDALIRLSSAVPSGHRITIRRETYADMPLVDFQDAAILIEEDLDAASLQALHVAQEARDVNNLGLVDTAGRVDSAIGEVLNAVEDARDSALAANHAAEQAAASAAEAVAAADPEGLLEVVEELKTQQQALTSGVTHLNTAVGVLESEKLNSSALPGLATATTAGFMSASDKGALQELKQNAGRSLLYNTFVVITESGDFADPITGWCSIDCIGAGGGGGQAGYPAVGYNGGAGGGKGGNTTFGTLTAEGGSGGGGGASVGPGGGGQAGCIISGYLYLTKGSIRPAIVGAGGSGGAGLSGIANTGSDGEGTHGGLGGYVSSVPGGGAAGAGNGSLSYSRPGCGGAGGFSGLPYGNGGGGGGAHNTGVGKGGAAGPGAQYGTNGTGTNIAAPGGDGGNGAIILRYYDPSKEEK